jgi:hypothetical protein
VVSHEEVEIRYVVPTNKASEQIHFSHLRADYRTRPQGDPEEMASNAILPCLPHGGAGDSRD